MVNCRRKLLSFYVGACFFVGGGVLERGFVAICLVGHRGRVRSWLDVWCVLCWLKERYETPCCLAGLVRVSDRVAIRAGLDGDRRVRSRYSWSCPVFVIFLRFLHGYEMGLR